MKKPYLFPILLSLLLTTIGFSCPEECESYDDVPLRIDSISTQALDNRADKPVLLPSGAEGFLNAYGFRLFLNAVAADSLYDGDFCDNYYLSPIITGCHIYSLTPFAGGPGADVSALFRYVDQSGYLPRYTAVSESAAQIVQDWNFTSLQRFDFLLVQPPAVEGWYQFELRLTMQDSTEISTVTDLIYLK
ncbi:MAG: DUF5034 domain-containing protein [Saprospiraceae bacterium]|nr:DUF5034 domain-containing protein [Saprospiraceae bacterium]